MVWIARQITIPHQMRRRSLPRKEMSLPSSRVSLETSPPKLLELRVMLLRWAKVVVSWMKRSLVRPPIILKTPEQINCLSPCLDEQTKFAIIGKFNLTSVLTHYKETNIAGDCSEALSFYLSFHFSLVLFCHILLNLFTKLSLFVIFLIFHDKYL